MTVPPAERPISGNACYFLRRGDHYACADAGGGRGSPLPDWCLPCLGAAIREGIMGGDDPHHRLCDMNWGGDCDCYARQWALPLAALDEVVALAAGSASPGGADADWTYTEEKVTDRHVLCCRECRANVAAAPVSTEPAP